jgi:hypothetical protein
VDRVRKRTHWFFTTEIILQDDNVGMERVYRQERNVDVQSLEEVHEFRGRLNQMDNALRGLLSRRPG